MYEHIAKAIALSWWQRWLVDLIVGQILKRLNKVGAGYFTRALAFEIRKKIVAEILRRIEQAKIKTPNFEIDEQALQCVAWVMESDTIQAEVNQRTGQKTDVHQRWTTGYHQP